ncbi:hypothetical protein M409DRAFT_56402 [Zasmidium cellare ATCC 36951]|uniref:Uncharacterized protein n=1 Tax=Zasmidium cellare ATCC 36951 TaxID=1080233 RepID=A0A6A6CEH6_ZASCE|nr:uncharacterized protein M409DRAFT_56402 [Zasmidium cellare ATCC 36951]KAF2164568.1 hypothetical protein M409DRAFT_56402 [Zasmidium cellare ATCC 36951]
MRGAALPLGRSELTGTRCVLSTAVVPGGWWCGAAEGGVQVGVAVCVLRRLLLRVTGRVHEATFPERKTTRTSGRWFWEWELVLCSHAVCFCWHSIEEERCAALLRRCAGPSSEPSTRFALGGGDREDRDGRGDSTLSCCERVEAKRHERQPATPPSWGICSISPSRARRRAGPHRSAIDPSNPSINNGRATHAPIRRTSTYPVPICCGGGRRVAEARESLTAAQDGPRLL